MVVITVSPVCGYVSNSRRKMCCYNLLSYEKQCNITIENMCIFVMLSQHIITNFAKKIAVAMIKQFVI